MLIFFLFPFIAFSQNYIRTNSSPAAGNICHTGGNLGIGTTTPQQLLELKNEYSVSLRLSRTYPDSLCEWVNWDIKNNGNLLFQRDNGYCDKLNRTNTMMTLTRQGQLSLGTETPDSSSLLQLESSKMGLLIPRMTSLQKNNISAPANGLLVFDTGLQKFSFYNKTAGLWQTVPTENDLSNYLLSNDFNNHPTSTITNTYITNRNTAHTWGNHATQGYLTAYTESDPNYTAWDKNYQDLTNKPVLFDGQWSSLAGTIPNISIFPNDAGYITQADIESPWIRKGNIIYPENIKNIVGIGTSDPAVNLHIMQQSKLVNDNGSVTCRLNHRLIGDNALPQLGIRPYDAVWDFENMMGTLNFKYAKSFLDDFPSLPITKFTFTPDGTLIASKFVGDGSGLTNLNYNGVWLSNGVDIYYNEPGGKIGIGTTEPHEMTELKNGNLMMNGGFLKMIKPETTGGWARGLMYYPDDDSIGNDKIWGGIGLLGSGTVQQHFYIGFGKTPWNTSEGLFVTTNGNVGIGSAYPDERLTVSGTIKAVKIWVQEEIAVQNTKPWPDFVFDKDYNLISIEDLQKYIKENGHLPDMPASEEVKKEGIKLAENQRLMLQKIEELTLYIINLKEENDLLIQRIIKLEK